MSASKGLWLIGEAPDPGEGEETKGEWGLQHLVKENAYADVFLNDTDADPITLIPGTCTWAMQRKGEFAKKNLPKEMTFGPVSATLDPQYIPVSSIIDNFKGADGVVNRVNFRFFGIRQVSQDGPQEEHHWLTLTGTNGWIKGLNYGLGEHGDTFSLMMTATVWRWQQYNSAGDLQGDCAAAHFDEKNAEGKITAACHAK